MFSVPCVPTDVTVEINCSNNEANVTWSASDGALFYKASSLSTQGSTSLCQTTELTCTLKNLTCGQAYMVQVVAQDDICSSLPSPAKSFHSGRTKQLGCSCLLILVTKFNVGQLMCVNCHLFSPSLSSMQT